MTVDSSLIDPSEVYAAVVERLDGELFEVTTEPTGWRCRQCGGMFSLNAMMPMNQPTFDRLVSNLVDAAEYHLRADHPSSVT